jgi:hypothetical protein
MTRALLALILAAPFSVPAQDGWDWRAETNAKLEHYDTHGDAAGSPYPVSGTHGTLGVSLDAERRPNPYDFTRFQFTGTQSESRYYSQENGFFPERINLTQQSGTAAIPYQAQVGDYFGVFSFRTLQTSLRGGLVELQPQAGHSVMLLSGAAGQNYREFQWRDNNFNGASYLYENRNVGRFAANWVNNARGELRSNVWSGAAEVPFNLPGQALRFETELARFSGDHDAGRERQDTGYYGELSSRGAGGLAPLDWRLRYEQYGKDYRPAGAVVSPDRISREAFAGWRFPAGPAVRGRVQAFRDGWDSGNLTKTDTQGLTLTGPLLAALAAGWTGNLEGYHQGVRNDLAPVDTRVYSLRADASRTFAGAYTLRLGYGYFDFDDRVNEPASSLTREVLATLSHGVRWAGWRAALSYGATLRRIDGGTSGASQHVLPLVSVSASQGRHNVLANLSYAYIDQAGNTAIDTRTSVLALAYRYAMPQDRLGAELTTNYRNPTPGARTEAYRFALTWTHFFEKAQFTPPGAAPLGPTPAGAAFDLRELAPGRPVASLQARLAQLGMRPSTAPAPGFLVYDYRVLDEITQRQRVVVRAAAGDIELSALLIEFEDVGNVDNMAQAFERVRQALIRRYGAPASVFNRGEFRPTLADDLQTEQFIRLTEWRAPEGVIRFGIPRRLDRTVRMEVQLARSFPAPTETRWSIEEVR